MAKGVKTGGRQKGTPNKASLPWKTLAKSICEDPEIQQKLHEACLTDLNLLVKVAEHAFGKPTQQIQADIREGWMLPAGDDVAEE